MHELAKYHEFSEKKKDWLAFGISDEGLAQKMQLIDALAPHNNSKMTKQTELI